MTVPKFKWWMPSHFERRHIGRWLSRCWHFRTTYPLDTYSADMLAGIDKWMLAEERESLLRFQVEFPPFVRMPMRMEPMGGSNWSFVWPFRTPGSTCVRNTARDTTLVWFIRSNCCDAPVMVFDNFQMDMFFIRCGQCKTVIDSASGEGIWQLSEEDSTMPPTA